MKICIYIYRVDNNESYDNNWYKDFYYTSYANAWNACISYKDVWHKWKDMNHDIYKVELNTNKTILLDRYDADSQTWEHGINKEIRDYPYYNESDVINNYNIKRIQCEQMWQLHNHIKHSFSINDYTTFCKRDLAIKAFKTYAYYQYKLDNKNNNIIMTNNERLEAIDIINKCLNFIYDNYNIPDKEFNKLLYAEYLNII